MEAGTPRAALALCLFALLSGPLLAGPSCPTPPAEVTGLLLGAPDDETLSWNADPCAASFNIYRGALSGLLAGAPPACHAYGIAGSAFSTPLDPPAGDGFVYLVTAVAAEEGSPGNDSFGPRPLLGSCALAERTHVLNRLGYGWDEWTRDRIAALGSAGYVAEQLDPASIDETGNPDLDLQLPILEPPQTIQELQGLAIVRAVYARRQLEQTVAVFWANHFNTDYNKSFPFFSIYDPDIDRKRLEATTLHYREMQDFRGIAFSGTFREILDASVYSSAMIIYLDTKDNLAAQPNENYARELVELHTMGVAGGYTEEDVAQLSRVFTGWNVCKKPTASVGDPLAPCVLNALIGTPSEPDGLWVANFRSNLHDCGQKILFAGTPEQVVIPATCDSPSMGLNDAVLALDAIAAHPSTKQFIAGKLLELFVSETPTQAMLDDVVAAWNDGSNPQGVGDLRAVLAAVLALPEWSDPDSWGDKIKTPFEQVASVFRAVRGNTNGTSTVRTYLERMGHLQHQNPVPTGYPEDGGSWLDTTNTLERQNFGADVVDGTGTAFGADLIPMLQANGVPTATGNAAAIVDFMADAMFGGALTPAERQSAIDFLQSDDSGNPNLAYTSQRIRQTAGFMLGFAQFQEQ